MASQVGAMMIIQYLSDTYHQHQVFVNDILFILLTVHSVHLAYFLVHWMNQFSKFCINSVYIRSLNLQQYLSEHCIFVSWCIWKCLGVVCPESQDGQITEVTELMLWQWGEPGRAVSKYGGWQVRYIIFHVHLDVPVTNVWGHRNTDDNMNSIWE